ncbi:MAG: hypothetical protein U0231_18895 [Nitrospiraceae bacterium]
MLRFEAQRSAHRVGIPMRRREVMARAAEQQALFAFWNRLTGRRRHPRANDPSLDFGVAGADWGMSTLSRWIVERTDHAAVVQRHSGQLRGVDRANQFPPGWSGHCSPPCRTEPARGSVQSSWTIMGGLIDYLRRRRVDPLALARDARTVARRNDSFGGVVETAGGRVAHPSRLDRGAYAVNGEGNRAMATFGVTVLPELRPSLGCGTKWNALVRDAGKSPFSTHEWLSTYWTHYGGSTRLYVLLVRAEGGQLSEPAHCKSESWGP